MTNIINYVMLFLILKLRKSFETITRV